MPQTDEEKTKILSKNTFPVVGIGASAGGLEAFRKLIEAIPENSGMAYIMVQHLHPAHESMLPDILQRSTKIPVTSIIDNEKVEPNHIYVIPSNKILVATDGVLQLSPRNSKERKNMPIDIFFSSLAEVHQAQSIGVVLSGTGSDGTAGLIDIKKHGGFTFVQDPSSAAYESMPQHAIDADIVDFVLLPETIPAKLTQLQPSFHSDESGHDANEKETGTEDAFRQILALIKLRSGVDFTFYKQTTVRRRIIRRMSILHIEKVSGYIAPLKKSTEELDSLFKDLLIQVTSFFRDKEAFDILCKNVFPDIIKNKVPDEPLRIWVAGCCTGQEAYSMAICLHEYFNDRMPDFKVQIFATDISEGSIKKARSGLYTAQDVQGIPEKRLQDFFMRTDGQYRVIKSVRDMCVFSVQNFLKDPPFSNIDFISCRNVLIYLEPFLQKKAFNIFHYSLNSDGTLWLGKSEATGSSSELFTPFKSNYKFYKRNSVPGKFINTITERIEKTNGINAAYKNDGRKDDVQRSVNDLLLKKYTPAGVVVNEQLDIVQFHGSVSKFIEPSDGKASLNILKMAKESLAFELRNGFRKVTATSEPFTKKNILLDHGNQSVSFKIIRLQNTIDPHYLVLFKSGTRVPKKEELTPSHVNGHGKASVKSKGNQSIRIHQLEKEAEQIKEDIRIITEDQDSANEELQSANEELLSGTEEMQSLNEELETSKEELQSTNEELITVNQELLDQNERLNQSRIFAMSTIALLHEPLIILNKNFIIKSANNAFYNTFKLTEEDTLGKVLFELHDNGWNIPGLRQELVKIQHKKEMMIKVEIPFDFPVIGHQIIAFNIQPIKGERGENLILLVLDDVTVRKNVQQLLQERAAELEKSSARFKFMTNAMPQKVWTADIDGNVNYFNQQWLDFTGKTCDELQDLGWKNVVHPGDWKLNKKLWLESIHTGKDFEMEHRLLRFDGTWWWHLSRGVAQKDDAGNVIMWIGTNTDIHEQKMKEQAKDDFISIASHELKTPLTTTKAYLQLLELDYSANKINESSGLYIKKANLSVNRLGELISELLDVSIIQNGKLDYHITSFNFNEMIDEAVKNAQNSSPDFNITKDGEASFEVTGDKLRLQQVVNNLLSNAIKYSPHEKKVCIKISEGKDFITVSVKDNGIGISRENIKNIFEKYYRANHESYKFQGLGIGLFISYEIIHRHRGKIWAESEEGKGSTFYFALPIEKVPGYTHLITNTDLIINA